MRQPSWPPSHDASDRTPLTARLARPQVFHQNGWFRFRTKTGGGVSWCNSCGNLGDSDFGAPTAVKVPPLPSPPFL